MLLRFNRGYNPASTDLRGGNMRLSGVVQEIADVIGRERALFLIGKLPRIYCQARGTSQGERVVMYVPKQITTQHVLVRILGWNDAAKLVQVFGGEVMQPGNCSEIYRAFRDRSIVRLHKQGMPKAELARLMNVHPRTITELLREKPQEERKAANDNNPPVQHRAGYERTSKHRGMAR
jgi:hypothetical protein